MSQQKLIGYHPGTGFIHSLSAVSKLLFFLIVSILAMITYDTRLILFIAVFSLALFKMSGIRYKEISLILILTIIFCCNECPDGSLVCTTVWSGTLRSRHSLAIRSGSLFLDESASILSGESSLEVFLYSSFSDYLSHDHSS